MASLRCQWTPNFKFKSSKNNGVMNFRRESMNMKSFKASRSMLKWWFVKLLMNLDSRRENVIISRFQPNLMRSDMKFMGFPLRYS